MSIPMRSPAPGAPERRMCFALIVVRLQEALSYDQFDTAEQLQFPVTFGDFVKMDENRR